VVKTTTIPLSPKGFRLGELLVVPDDPARELSADQLIRDVEAAGYRRVSEIDDWQLFRPRSSWRDGIRRHAQLRTRDLVLRVERDAAGARVRVAGLLTSPLERHLATLGALYAPATP
jgi:hypothetical protein